MQLFPSHAEPCRVNHQRPVTHMSVCEKARLHIYMCTSFVSKYMSAYNMYAWMFAQLHLHFFHISLLCVCAPPHCMCVCKGISLHECVHVCVMEEEKR